ncbi:type II toxin-antitoxin system VapB family antitoxin [Nocardia sp. NPDC001965]|nr:antitoxin [Nocardia sp.]NUS92356.1 antitoxin [Nocardia sp.]
MTDILIRAVPGAVIDEIDRQANGLGISRTEFLRRRLSREFRPVGGVTTADLIRLAGLIGEEHTPDLLSPDLAETEFADPGLTGPHLVDEAPA